MKIENLLLKNAIQKLRLVVFSGILLLAGKAAADPAPTSAPITPIKTRWFSYYPITEFEPLSDPSGQALLLLKAGDLAGTSINVIRAASSSKTPINQAISEDYVAVGFSNISVESLPKLSSEQLQTVVVRYSDQPASELTNRVALVGRWQTLDESTLWVTFVTPPTELERALGLYEKFLTRFAVNAPPPTELEDRGTFYPWVDELFLIVGLLLVGRKYLRERRGKPDP